VGSQVITLNSNTGEAGTSTQGSTVGDGSGAAGGTAETGSATLFASNNPCTAFEFDGGNTYPGQNCLGAFPDGDLRVEINLMWLQTGNTAQLLGSSFDATTQAPAAGYAGGPFVVLAGQVYAFSLLGGSKYGLLEISSVTNVAPGVFNIGIRYKFQPDGSRNF
jgi:hypothetical protein